MIPARSGSKGIPGKNLRQVAGRSLVARSIDAARAAETIDAVVVSTDGDAIAAEALSVGARIVRRPEALAGDEASSESALLHALDVLTDPDTGDADTAPEVLVFLQATSPFTRADELDAAVARVLDGGADAVLAAAPSHAFIWRVAEDGSAVAVNHDAATRPRRQDRAPEYRETGAFYVVRVAGFREARHRFFGRVELAVVPARTAVDIDDADDLALAAALAPLVEADTSAQAPTQAPAPAPAPAPAQAPTQTQTSTPAPGRPQPAAPSDPHPHPARATAAENGAP
ncbi:acylneuraminate cytidylyltransferase family protein [Curtobacterium sp. L6-1]|uniref:Acylneuraminate cytidylyltransferase family protein n=1 Tax=Curtobacterium aetherium TaxID=2841594 RepID=A0ACD1E8F9_9MICO|nr:acylneuraminate cytidylyltransferase family protein [Curtobacterium sp. L6-1]